MALAFSSDAEREIDAIVARYPDRGGALIPVLFLAQEEFGYLTQEAMELVARRLELPPAKVLNTATFYTMLRKKPFGRYHLQICRTLSCYLRGGDDLIEVAREKLGIAPGETTPDKLFTLETVECLAACGTAPIVRVDKAYHEGVTRESFAELLEALQETAKREAGR